MRFLFVFFVVVVVSGCASVSESYAPDGRKSYALNCSGNARGWDKCFSKAGELCRTSGYDILDRIGEDNSSERSMVISCKN